MRDVRGLLHAVYVFGNLRCFWQRVASRSPQSSSFARSRIAAISEELGRGLDAGAQPVSDQGGSPAGRVVFDDLLSARVFSRPVRCRVVASPGGRHERSRDAEAPRLGPRLRAACPDMACHGSMAGAGA